VDEVLERALGVEGLSPVTSAWARGGYRSLRRYLETTGGQDRLLAGVPASQVTVLDDWVAWLRAKATKRATINSYWRALVFLGTRIERRTGFLNIFRLRPAPHPGMARLTCLTRDQAARILTWTGQVEWPSPFVRARNLALLAVMTLAGLRRTEALTLAVADVDCTMKTISVRAGKGRHGGRPRTVPMTEQLCMLLQRYVEHRRHRGSVQAQFFLAASKDAAMTPTMVKRIFQHVARGTGIEASPHVLRHTFCTLLSQSGMSDRLAMQAMGHADLRMLQRYQHVYAGEVAQEIQRLRLDLPL